MEHLPALLAQAEAFLRDRRILLPALSTLRRLAGEQREQARSQLYTRMMACLPPEFPARLDVLLHVDADARLSPLQALKAPPGIPSPRALSQLTTRLDQIQATGVLPLDLRGSIRTSRKPSPGRWPRPVSIACGCCLPRSATRAWCVSSGRPTMRPSTTWWICTTS